MVELAIKYWGDGSYIVKQMADQPHEAGLLKLDISKVLVEVNWKPKFNASSALDYTVTWYNRYFTDRDNIAAFTEKQIMDFLNG